MLFDIVNRYIAPFHGILKVSLTIFVSIPADGILVDLPLGRKGHILCRHGIRNLCIPALEGIAFLHRIGRCRHICAVILGNCIDDAVTGFGKGDGVLVDTPLGIQGVICQDGKCTASFQRIRIGIRGPGPAQERVTFFFRCCGQGDCLLITAGYGCYVAAALGIEGNGVNDGNCLKDSIVSCCTGNYRQTLQNLAVLAGAPAQEGVGVGLIRSLTAVKADQRGIMCCSYRLVNLTVSVDIEADLIAHGGQGACEGHIMIGHGHTISIITPAAEGIARLGGICRQLNDSAVSNVCFGVIFLSVQDPADIVGIGS